jgi:tripartite-type tricarboxylate transporter receptor subunit TctC
VPAPIVAALRKAFDDTMNDPEFIATLRGANIEFNPLDGERLSAVVAKTMALPKSTIDQYRAAVASE